MFCSLPLRVTHLLGRTHGSDPSLCQAGKLQSIKFAIHETREHGEVGAEIDTSE